MKTARELLKGLMILGAVATLPARLAAGGEEEKPSELKPGDKAPAFTLKDVDGKDVSLADYSGKIVVLEWINQQCPVSHGKHKDKTMQDTAKKFEGQPVVWLSIDSSHYADPKANKDYAEKMGLTYPILHDQDGKVGKAYGAMTTPHMFVIDKEGVLAYAGAIDGGKAKGDEAPRNYVAEAVDALLKGSTVAVASTKPYGCSVKYAN